VDIAEKILEVIVYKKTRFKSSMFKTTTLLQIRRIMKNQGQTR
jgi:hypothetical protein